MYNVHVQLKLKIKTHVHINGYRFLVYFGHVHQGWARDTIDACRPVPSGVRRDFCVFSHGPSGPSRPVKVKIY